MQQNTIFLFLPQQQAYFYELKQGVSYLLSDIFVDNSREGITNALKFRHQLKYLGKQCESLTVLCIPARQHIAIKSSKTSEYPKFIKVEFQTNKTGYLSGRRSAIFIDQTGRMLRYKGCGNDAKGFIYENNQLRGSHFFHTAKRQLYMTALINKILAKEINIESANIPLQMYEFTQNIESIPLKNDLRLLGKYCCIFQTKGDRRVGTHLISPLQILFLNIIDLNEEKWKQIFLKEERLDNLGDLTQLLVDFDFSLSKGQMFIEKYKNAKQFTNYIDIQKLEGQNNLVLKKQFNQIINKVYINYAKQNYDGLSQNTDWIKIIRLILCRLGWQMGEIKRIFCQNRINWGFFNDHGYWHCNAHLNNFILRYPAINQRFTLPLDFDLAFTEEQYLNIDLSSNTYGQRDDDDFQNLFLAEYNAMEMSLSGVEVMNFKYSIQENNQKPSQAVKMARIIFRDTLVKYFRLGARNKKQQIQAIDKQWNENLQNIIKLVHLCLEISANFQT